MYVKADWAGPRLRGAIRLGLSVLLAATVLLPSLLDLPVAQLTGFVIAGTVCALVLGDRVIATLRAEGYSRDVWLEVVPSILIIVVLVVGLLLNWESFAPWLGEVIVASFVVFYLVELRSIVKRNPAIYAALALGGLLVVVALALADVEADDPDRKITNAGEAMLWALAQVFRSHSLISLYPVTETGRRLGFIVMLSGMLFSAVVFSAVTAWAVRYGRDRHNPQRDEEVRRQVRAVLEEAGLIAPTPANEHQTSTIIDVDWIAGSQPGAWWASRALTTARVLRSLREGFEPSDDEHVICVVSRAFESVDGGTGAHGNLQIESASDPAAHILDRAREGDTVVTGRGRLARRLVDRGIEVIEPGDLAQHRSGTAPGA